MKPYYESYDDRYRQVHEKNLQWASDEPSPIVYRVINRYGAGREAKILELGCGEGRDAIALLEKGYSLTATDISPEAVRYCRNRWPQYAQRFRTLDCVRGVLEEKFDVIYAVAVIHMLVEDGHRAEFYRFIRDHLNEDGIALVCTMGDGTAEVKSDISAAFDLRERTPGQTGKHLMLAGTSCRMVNWETFLGEIRENGMTLLDHGLTEVPPDFPVMMYAVMRKQGETLSLF